MKKYLLGLDEGTTSARAVLYDLNSHKIIGSSRHLIKQFYPQNGWVEQDATQIYSTVTLCMREVLREFDVGSNELAGVGLTNQRETIVAFDIETGEPVYNAIVWQCRRTADYIASLPAKTKTAIREKTGLIPDAYFSASKMKWILENVPKAKELAKLGKLRIGTIDAYLAYKLTGNFVTDTTNASRTMLFNIHTLDYDDELLKFFGVSRVMLPKIAESASVIGKINFLGNVELCSIIGDQQSSLFGQGCTKAGMAKNTYGTGGFILMNTGTSPVSDCKNLLSTVALTLDGKTTYALEGSIFSVSSAINWLGHSLRLFQSVNDTEDMSFDLPSNQGVYFVPAFTGLGAPYWQPNARAIICGLTFDSDRRHIVRAVLESICYNTKAIIDEMSSAGIKISSLRVDGGACKNNFLMQFQADMLDLEVKRLATSEATVLGCIYLAGICKKVIKVSDLPKIIQMGDSFKPHMSDETRNKLYSGWQNAVKKSCEDK